MLVVVTDSSPLRALHHLGLLTLCRDLFGTVIVPEAVRRELLTATSTCPAIEILDYSWFETREARAESIDLGVPMDLDAGEMAAISLAIELHADLILMDERKGTEAARQLGLTAIGVLGVLLDAKRKGLIDRVLPNVDRLISDLRFFVSPKVREQLAELAKE